MKPMGFWARFLASMIDGLISTLFISVPLAIFFIQNSKIGIDWQNAIEMFILFFLIIYLWVKFGATPGKMLLGATIVDAKTGKPPTKKQFIIRYFAYALSIFSFFLGFAIIPFNKKKQALHDMIAGTMVVYKDSLKK